LAEIKIELLEKRHDRKRFDCGNQELDRYLKTLARQQHDQGFVKVYVAVEEGQNEVLGYFALAMGNILLQDADETVYARLPKHPMPVLHVARLATDKRFAGKGFGSLLLSHAADIAIAASESMGVYALELVAIDPSAYAYYLRRGFLPLMGDGMRLYAPLATIHQARAQGAP
jgi:GNAT superfamily N-acetyltransferase